MHADGIAAGPEKLFPPSYVPPFCFSRSSPHRFLPVSPMVPTHLRQGLVAYGPIEGGDVVVQVGVCEGCGVGGGWGQQGQWWV